MVEGGVEVECLSDNTKDYSLTVRINYRENPLNLYVWRLKVNGVYSLELGHVASIERVALL